ncbi:MAG TPA: PAS domain S-box protein [Steroidobacteraceae bacterium]|nr:PAS domain S-box protein [Steroidobacteraceae bacterium]
MSAEPDDQHARDADQLCRLLIARVRDYAIFMLDPNGKVISWNEGAQAIKGYSADEIVGRDVSTFYTVADVERGHYTHLLQQAAEKGRVEDEGWRVRKDGTRFWADVVITALRDDSGKLRGFAKITRDLTEQRQAQDAISELSGRLLKLQDEQRRRLAVLLHDRTSPQLTGILGGLHKLTHRVPAHDREGQREVADLIRKTEATADVIQQISHMLHPPMLEQGGFVEALRSYLEAVPADGRTEVKADLPSLRVNVPRDAEIALFRLVQECLTHLVGTSGRRQVAVRLRSNGALVLEITIQGAIPPNLREDVQERRGDFGLGLAGMRERLRQLGGTFAIITDSEKTAIEASLPLSA